MFTFTLNEDKITLITILSSIPRAHLGGVVSISDPPPLPIIQSLIVRQKLRNEEELWKEQCMYMFFKIVDFLNFSKATPFRTLIKILRYYQARRGDGKVLTLKGRSILQTKRTGEGAFISARSNG